MNLANKLTTARMIAIPFFVAAFYLPDGAKVPVTVIIFILAYVTDLLDGKIARKRNEVTVYGKFMDPIADKLLSHAALVMLCAEGSVSPVAVIIILSREFIISGMRLLVAEKGTVGAASWAGKVKTFSQFIALTLLLAHNPLFSAWSIPMDQIALWVSVVFTVWSGIDYAKAYSKYIDFSSR